MKNKKQKLSVLFLGFGIIGLSAQEATVSSGGNGSGTGGSVSYSIGQVFYKTNREPIGSVAQGVQQPYEISVVSEIEKTQGISLIITTNPNPATEFINLKIKNFKVENLKYRLYDGNGKLLESKKINSSETKIVLTSYVPAVYFLEIIEGNIKVKIFKIIKN